MSKPAARNPTTSVSGFHTSILRTAIAAALVILGIVWITVYIHLAMDAANFDPQFGGKKPDTPLPWMSDLKKWNFAIGFGAIFVGLMVSAHQATPLGRGRGVVIGMLGCFLIGLIWIVSFYFVGQETKFHVPVMDQLDQFNLLVGIGFMAVGFAFATKWE